MRTGWRLSLAAAPWRSPPAPATRQQPGRRHRLNRLPPPEQPVDPPGDGSTDPDEDARTQPQRDFDDALTSAREGLADARTAANNAVAAASAARTDDARTRAQADIAKARTALIDAVNAAKALAELSSDPGRLGERAIFVDAAEAARIEDLAKLLRAEARTGWAGDVAAADIAWYPTVAVERRPRRDSENNFRDTVLEADDFPARMHEHGKTVMGGDGSSGEQLQMRGMPIVNFRAGRLMYRFTPARATDLPAAALHNLAAIQNNRSKILAGLTIKPDGLEIEMGGKYAPGHDFRVGSLATTYAAYLAQVPGTGNNPNPTAKGNDLILNFGRPGASPEGSAEHYWTAALMPTAANVASAGGDGGWLRDGDRTLPISVYDVRLSNHIGFDPNQEDPDADEPYTADDENFYLTHAAYGFLATFRPTPPTGSYAAADGTGRAFPFQVGYDAFKDEAGMRTTDIGSAAITSGMFKGRTMAMQIRAKEGVLYANPNYLPRMRGDIELIATISGDADDNTIKGTISNMEQWDSKGYWEDSTIMPDDIRFHTDGTIDAKGEFTGTFANYPAGFHNGGYRGNFYGPKESLEAAGTWGMSLASNSATGVAGIVGSFGAALVRDDGTYGRVVQGTEASASD